MAEPNAARVYAEERDVAFVAFVEDGDFTHIDALMDKWGLQRTPHTDKGAAAVYKAVQECVNISYEVKAEARRKCLEMGFTPFMPPLAWTEGDE